MISKTHTKTEGQKPAKTWKSEMRECHQYFDFLSSFTTTCLAKSSDIYFDLEQTITTATNFQRYYIVFQ